MSLVHEMRLLAIETAIGDAWRRHGIEGVCPAAIGERTPGSETLQRPPHRSEGTSPRCVNIPDPWHGERPTDAAMEIIDLMARNVRDLEDRDAAIRSAGDDPNYAPPWAFLVNALARTIVVAEGHDPLDMVRPDNTRRQRRGTQTRIREIPEKAIGLNGLMWDGMIAGPVATLMRRTDDWDYEDHDGRALLKLSRVLPATVLQGVCGEALDDVLSDRRLRGSGIRIRRGVASSTGYAILILEGGWEPFAPPPAGVEAPWLRIGTRGVPTM